MTDYSKLPKLLLKYSSNDVLFTLNLITNNGELRDYDNELANRIEDAKACIKYARKAAAAIEELKCQLRAWQSVFGTSQLSHAQARLEAAEKALAEKGAASPDMVLVPKEPNQEQMQIAINWKFKQRNMSELIESFRQLYIAQVAAAPKV